MSEEQAKYEVEGEQPAAIIDPPRKVKALRDSGLIEYQVWGWVKTSAKFIAHIKKLKGAKLAIWQVIALSIDETGTCKMPLKTIGELTGYSHTEVIESIKELDEAGYLTVNRDGKTNIYSPVFVARGEGKPQETLVKKLDSTTLESSPVYQNESSPSLEKSDPSFKRVKRVNTQNTKLDLARSGIDWAIAGGEEVDEESQKARQVESEAVNAFESAWGISRPWDWWNIKKDWRDLLAAVVEIYQSDPGAFVRYVHWYDERGKFEGGKSAPMIQRDPTCFYSAWDMFKRQDKPDNKDNRTSLLRTL